MTSFYESATRGLNFDRFVTEEIMDESTFVKMKQHFWTAKQLLRTKLGKKEDDHLLASDAEFDTKLTLYYSIRDTSRGLLASIEDIHHFMNGLTENERDLGMLLNRQAQEEKEHIANIIKIVGDTNVQAARSRMLTLKPIVKMYHELDMFNDRAITDCSTTIEATEKARLEYRGSLMWLKKMSEELDPDTGTQMDKYRTAQTVVRQNKEKLDKLKEDSLQKVDLLEESRSIFLYETTLGYLDALHDYFKESTQIYADVLDKLQGIDSYEIDVLKILNDPIGVTKEKENNKKRKNSKHTTVDRHLNENKQDPQTLEVTYDLLNFNDDENVKVQESEANSSQNTNLFDISGAFLQEEIDEPDLISIDQPRSLIEERDEIRLDSPLGILNASKEDEIGSFGFSESSGSSHLVGPLPTLPNLTNPQTVPKLQPPTGWINKVKNTAQQGIFGGSSDLNFMPSKLFDQDEMTTSSNDKTEKDWSTWLGDFDPLRKQNQDDNDPNSSNQL